MRHRIVQFQGRRFSLKLDDIVWQSLEEIAAGSGKRLNRLVAEVADGAGSAENLTGALRRYCLESMRADVSRLTREVEDLALTARGASVATFVDACPAPCLILTQNHRIVRINAAAQAWMAVDGEALIGRSVEHYFQVRAELSLTAMVERFRQQVARLFPARVVYVRPGRVVVARVNFCLATADRSSELTYLMMVDQGSAGLP